MFISEVNDLGCFYKALKLSPNDELIMANISYVEELLNQQK